MTRGGVVWVLALLAPAPGPARAQLEPGQPSSFSVAVPAQRAAQNLYQALTFCQEGSASLRSQPAASALSPQGSTVAPSAQGEAAAGVPSGGSALSSGPGNDASSAAQGATTALAQPNVTYVILSHSLGYNVFNGTLQVAASGGGAIVQIGQGSAANELILSRLRSWAATGAQC